MSAASEDGPGRWTATPAWAELLDALAAHDFERSVVRAWLGDGVALADAGPPPFEPPPGPGPESSRERMRAQRRLDLEGQLWAAERRARGRALAGFSRVLARSQPTVGAAVLDALSPLGAAESERARAALAAELARSPFERALEHAREVALRRGPGPYRIAGGAAALARWGLALEASFLGRLALVEAEIASDVEVGSDAFDGLRAAIAAGPTPFGASDVVERDEAARMLVAGRWKDAARALCEPAFASDGSLAVEAARCVISARGAAEGVGFAPRSGAGRGGPALAEDRRRAARLLAALAPRRGAPRACRRGGARARHAAGADRWRSDR